MPTWIRRNAWRGLVLGCALLAGCDSGKPLRSGPGLTRLDKDTQYVMTPTAQGFTLTMYLDRYQFAPALKALGEDCTQRFLTLAQELATQQGRALQSLAPEAIQRNVTRDGVRGITSCVATAPALWQE